MIIHVYLFLWNTCSIASSLVSYRMLAPENPLSIPLSLTLFYGQFVLVSISWSPAMPFQYSPPYPPPWRRTGCWHRGLLYLCLSLSSSVLWPVCPCFPYNTCSMFSSISSSLASHRMVATKAPSLDHTISQNYLLILELHYRWNSVLLCYFCYTLHFFVYVIQGYI